MFVLRAARRQGLASKMLRSLEQQTQAFAYQIMRLETGNRQLAAKTLHARRQTDNSRRYRPAPYRRRLRIALHRNLLRPATQDEVRAAIAVLLAG